MGSSLALHSGSGTAAAVAQIQSLAWELPYATVQPFKKKKKKEKEKAV